MTLNSESIPSSSILIKPTMSETNNLIPVNYNNFSGYTDNTEFLNINLYVTPSPNQFEFYDQESIFLQFTPSLPRYELRNLPHLPVTADGINLANLEMFLNNILWNFVTNEQVQAIKMYFSQLHKHLPIIDVDYFLYHLSLGNIPGLTVIMNDLVAIYKITLRDIEGVKGILSQVWEDRNLYLVLGFDQPYHTPKILLDTVVARAMMLILPNN